MYSLTSQPRERYRYMTLLIMATTHFPASRLQHKCIRFQKIIVFKVLRSINSYMTRRVYDDGTIGSIRHPDGRILRHDARPCTGHAFEEPAHGVDGDPRKP